MTDKPDQLDLEKLSEQIHGVYCRYYKDRHGEEYWTKGNYSKLDEATKEADRYMARFIKSLLAETTTALEAEREKNKEFERHHKTLMKYRNDTLVEQQITIDSLKTLLRECHQKVGNVLINADKANGHFMRNEVIKSHWDNGMKRLEDVRRGLKNIINKITAALGPDHIPDAGKKE